ncbi:MAG TPA: ABC transporter permease [Roseiarcus sp.]|nr:ABC transporter permease [Roseiarcus sp.]
MRPAPKPGLLLVATRELRWMRRDGVALVLALIVPVIAFAILTLIFSNAVIRNLRVAIVDADRSATSLTYVQAIGSAPGVSVAERSSDMRSAMRAVRSGDAIAAIYIPENFERDLLARQRPQVVALYNRQYYTPGNNAASAISNAVAAATAALPQQASGGGYRPGALVAEQYVLSNPALNFAQFLLRAILPTVLHVVVALAGGYAVGSEFSRRSKRAWMRTAGGRPLVAFVGKLLPLFGIFLIMAVVNAAIIHALYGVTFRGDPVLVAAAACLHIVAYLSLGALLVLLTQDLASGLSLIAVFCNPAFGFAGVGFPVTAMGTFAQAWGAMLPLRWYLQVLFDQAARGVPTSNSVRPFAILAGFACLLFALAWARLRAVARAPARRVEAPAPRIQYGRGVALAMGNEARRILADRSVLSLIVLAPILYGLLYPQPYLGQLLRGIPIAVVDQDQTELSRDLVQALNADEATTVALRADTLADAQAALDRHDVFAILAVPKDTERQVLRGEEARIAAYVDAAYFLLYSRTLQGISEAAATASANIAMRGARSEGSFVYAAMTRGSSPINFLSQPLYNPTGGYASYVVPAAFILILQQTLLLGVASLGGAAYALGGPANWRRRAGARAVFGQALAHLCFALPGLALYLIVLPRVYGFSTLGRLPDLILMSVPFVLSVSFLAQFVSAWFRRRETPILLLIAVSLPLFFQVGVSWPVEAIPDFIRAASRVFPSTSAIDGLVRINQMGASVMDVRSDWTTLWILTIVYGLLAVAATVIVSRSEARHDQ